MPTASASASAPRTRADYEVDCFVSEVKRAACVASKLPGCATGNLHEVFLLDETGRTAAEMDAATRRNVTNFCSAAEVHRLAGTPATSMMVDVAYVELVRGAGLTSRVEIAGGGVLTSAFVDKAITGTAALIAERAQAELALWLVSDFSKHLCDSRSPANTQPLQPKYWFPETCRVAGQAGEQPSGMLASAFRQDLDGLPYAMLGDLMAYLGGARDDARLVSEVTRGAVKRLREGLPLREALAASLAVATVKCSTDNEVTCGLAMIRILVEAIDDAVGEDGRVTFDDVLVLLSASELAARLKLEVIDPYGTSSHTPFGKLVQHLRVALAQVDTAGQITPVGVYDAASVLVGDGSPTSVTRLFDAIGRVAARRRDPSGENRTQAIFIASLDVVAALLELVVRFQQSEADLAIVMAAISPAFEASRHFAKHEWQEGGREILKVLLKVTELTKPGHPLNPCLTASAAVRCLQGKELDEALRVATRSLTFVVDASSAESAEDFKAALDAAAAPLGGWRRKTERFTAAFGAMAGLSFGGEVLLETSDGDVGGYVAPMAMVGLDLAGPIAKRSRRRSSLGVFVSALDIGNLAAQRVLGNHEDRLEDDEEGVKERPTIGVRQVLSPGLFVRLGIAETPITLVGGASVVPDLREVQDSQRRDSWALRFTLGLAIDVTLFPLRGRTRK